MTELTALSLFSSAGIGELEAHKNTLNVVAANELLERRADCYSHFYPETKMFQGDILDTDLQNKIIKYCQKEDVNFLIATPPCQGLSSAGKNKQQKDFIMDSRNFLVMEVFKFIDNLNLDYILIENVPRFLNMYFPYEGEMLLLTEVLERRYRDKYEIEARILNAKDYGICQSRPRAIIKMYSKGLSWEWPEPQAELTLKEVIGHLPSLEAGEDSGIKWHYANKAKESIIEAMKHTPPGKSAFENEFYYPKKEDGTRISGFHNTYKRMKWDSPASARTTYSGSISSHNNVHPGRLQKDGTYSDARVFTLLENFLVSSIDPEIEFPEWASDTFIRTIIGEAIPPKLLNVICEPLKNK